MSHISSRPRPKASVTEELLGEELFLYAGAGSEAVHNLNSGAALIWYLCDGTRDAQTIAQELATAFDIPLGQVQSDVTSTLSRLSALGLLEIDEPVSTTQVQRGEVPE